MTEDRNLELNTVIQRFSASSKALDELQERISALSHTSDALTKSNAGIQEATTLIRKFVSEISNVTEGLHRSNTGIQIAVEAASKLLHGTEVNQIKVSVDQILAAIQTQLTAANSELRNSKANEGRVQQELADLKKRIATLSSRAQKKIG